MNDKERQSHMDLPSLEVMELFLHLASQLHFSILSNDLSYLAHWHTSVPKGHYIMMEQQLPLYLYLHCCHIQGRLGIINKNLTDFKKCCNRETPTK